MPDRPPSAAGGFLIVVGIVLGAVVGLLIGQATPATLIGLSLGIVAAVLVWLRDRRR